jgi:hypothetical protein
MHSEHEKKPASDGRTAFQEFIEKYGLPCDHIPVTDNELVNYQNLLPESLLDFWQRFGFGSYADGLLWIHSPNTFEDVIEEWTGLPPDQTALIFRSSFGNFCIWKKNRAYLIDVHFGRISQISQSIEFLFNYLLCREQFLKDVLISGLHQQSVAKLGALSVDECFTFVPAKALGGSGKLDDVQRVSMQEQLLLLSKIVGPLVIR